MAGDPACLPAALAYALRGWPTFPVKPQAKEPLTAHGVKDATLDADVIRKWFRRWPNANVAIACGAPGPQVLDIDDLLVGRDALAVASRLGGPDVATARGRQFYFIGNGTGTIVLPYGELRGVGSYVVAPPSTHPTGKLYVFVVDPTDAPLPRFPEVLLNGHAKTAGTGVLEAGEERIAYGQRHEALKDAAVRFLRGGITDVRTLELMVRSYFEARCELLPKPKPDEFAKIAAWAARSRMAERERMYAEFDQAEAEATETATKGKAKRSRTGLENPPRGDAPLKDHRAFVSVAGGWGDRIDVKTVVRGGQRPVDWLEITLTNGQRIWFDRQDQVAQRGHWLRLVTMFTNGIASPVALNEIEAAKVLRSLCILADAPAMVSEAGDLADAVATFVAKCDRLDEHDLSSWEGRYDAITHCRAREQWDPFHESDERHPAVLVDRDGARYVRAGELRAWLSHEGFKLDAGALAGRMALIGVERVSMEGREQRRPDREGRETAHMIAYRLPPEGSVAE